MFTVHITPNDKGNPPGKLADAALHFSDGPLGGLKLIGFSVWERRGGGGRNGERRSFALLRPVADHDAQLKVKDAILEAYAAFEAHIADAAANGAAAPLDFAYAV
jgi:hypothetical protein